MELSIIILAGRAKPRMIPQVHQIIIVKNRQGRGYGIVEGLKQVTGTDQKRGGSMFEEWAVKELIA